MSFLNQIHIIGNLTADPQFSTTKNGNSVCNMNVATNEFWNDKQGERQQETEYHIVTVWGKTAEFCNNYLKKGQSVYLEGRKQTKEYPTTTPLGEEITKFRCEIIASKVLKLTKDQKDF